MPIYQLQQEQVLNCPIEDAWNFISSPRNLQKITPDYMGFEITSSNLPEKMHPGMIISYKVSPILRIKMTWVTEITHVKHLSYFVDEQRVGPYKMWHHEHWLIEQDNGQVHMKDLITYQPPFGLFGALTNKFLIRKQLREIFDYRRRVLNEMFPVN